MRAPMATSPAPRTGPPSIAVLICAYTSERLPSMTQAVAALEAGTVAPAEIVFAIDHSPGLLAEARELWPHHHIVENENKQGLSGARNSGVAAAQAEVIAFLDDDAIPAPDWIERLGDAYEDDTVLGVGGAVRPRWLEGEPRWFPPEFDWVVGCTHSGMPSERRDVRNVIGANMSFRRAELVEVGGFREEFGRVGKDTAGAEETDLCIRVGQRWPGARIVYEPAATVEHWVPGARSNTRYFFQRCRGEGRSKRVLSRMVGSEDGLSEERDYVRRTLPLGVLRGLGRGLRGDLSGPERAAMIVAGLAATSWGYATAPRPVDVPAPGTEPAAGDAAPLRILEVTPRSPLLQGGVERHVMEVSRRVAAAGQEVSVLCTDPGGAGLAEEVRDGVPIRSVRGYPANSDWCLAPRLWPQIKRAKPDVIHVQSYHTLVAPLAMLRALVLRVPYVVTFHGGGHSSEHRNKARGAQRRLLRPLLRRAARLVAVARFEVEEYGAELGLGPDRFALIPNGTDLSFSAQPWTPRTGPPLIATVGRLERYKGHHLVIESLPELLAREPEARLLVVGKGPYEGELKALAERLGVADKVEFTSTPPDRPEAMAELLRTVSVVVLMSSFETHPLVALESAAAGCRLVVADASGLGELAAEGLARPVPLDAPAAEIAAATAEELQKNEPPPKPKLSSWDDCADALLQLYREVA
jgi:glycosyltransferase involved in cell wall biosynthesis/GT2 family glycosyltransferase